MENISSIRKSNRSIMDCEHDRLIGCGFVCGSVRLTLLYDAIVLVELYVNLCFNFDLNSNYCNYKDTNVSLHTRTMIQHHIKKITHTFSRTPNHEQTISHPDIQIQWTWTHDFVVHIEIQIWKKELQSIYIWNSVCMKINIFLFRKTWSNKFGYLNIEFHILWI